MSHPRLNEIDACVFDAYGTLFDVNAAAQHAASDLGDKWQPLADIWRQKQLQYTWLRALMDAHTDFWAVTGDALDFAMASLDIDDDALRQKLLDLYLKLDAYEEVKETLAALKERGKRLAILSNGSRDMLAAAVDNAGIGDLLDAVFSVDAVGIFKPHPSVYKMAVDGFGLPPDRMSFQSANGWDAFAAKNYGYQVVWINRFGQAVERIPDTPDVVLSSLHGLPDVVAGD